MPHHHLGEKVRMERKEVVANHGICSFCRHVGILFILSYILLWITQSFFVFFFVLVCFMHHPIFFFFFFVVYIFFIVFAIWYFLMPKDMDDCQQV